MPSSLPVAGLLHSFSWQSVLMCIILSFVKWVALRHAEKNGCQEMQGLLSVCRLHGAGLTSPATGIHKYKVSAFLDIFAPAIAGSTYTRHHVHAAFWYRCSRGGDEGALRLVLPGSLICCAPPLAPTTTPPSTQSRSCNTNICDFEPRYVCIKLCTSNVPFTWCRL